MFRQSIILSYLLLFLSRPILSSSRAECQIPGKPEASAACPPNTIVVGPNGGFKTVQSAIRSLPGNDVAYTILIQPGTYHEQVNITRSGPITLLGVTSDPDDASKNTVTVLWKAATGTKETGSADNAFTSALTVAPTLDSSLTGSGPTGHDVAPGTRFGNSNFRAYNVDFVNDYKPQSAGPSHAIGISYANAGFYFCSIRSYQDTVYIGKLGNAYFYDSEIAGQTDFLYGFGTAWIQSSKLLLRNCGGGITAWKGTKTSFPNKYGVYIVESQVVKANASLAIRGKCSLGRPWNSEHRSLFAKCNLDDSILPAGYTEWSSNDNRFTGETLMAEYGDTGPGFNAAARKEGKITRILSDKDFEQYATPESIFQTREGKYGNTDWIDRQPKSR